MTKTLEKTGRTEDIAIAAALEELGLDRDDVSVEILERAKSGFLGLIGASDARVLVTYEVPDEPVKKPEFRPETKKPTLEKAPLKKDTARAEENPEQKKTEKKKEAPKPEKAPAKKPEPVKEENPAEPRKEKAPRTKAPVSDEEEFEAIRTFLTGLFEKMDVSAEMDIGRRDNGGIIVRLSGAGMGAIIGRRGETLDAIQHLTNYVVNRGSDKRMHISIDAEEYRARREESLSKLAEKMAEKALKYGRGMALEPMNSYERHVIHTALQNYEGVTTASIGEEPNRRVVVSPVKPETAAAPKKPRTREWA